jgi:hypothetical protein
MTAMAVQISRTITACAPALAACDTIAVPATPNAMDPSAMNVIATLCCPTDGAGGRDPGTGTWYPGGSIGP